jgi:hypothetical protein
MPRCTKHCNSDLWGWETGGWTVQLKTCPLFQCQRRFFRCLYRRRHLHLKISSIRVDTKFRIENYFRISRNFVEISQTYFAKFRESKLEISRNKQYSTVKFRELISTKFREINFNFAYNLVFHETEKSTFVYTLSPCKNYARIQNGRNLPIIQLL